METPAWAVWEALAAHCAGKPEAEVLRIIQSGLAAVADTLAADDEVKPDAVVENG